jgi:hypothetical protein
MRLLRAAYGWFARHRGCANGVCGIEAPVSRRVADALPLTALPVVYLLAATRPRWLE